MDENKTKRAAIILKKIDPDALFFSEENNVLHIEDEPQFVKVTNFLYNFQQPTKKIDVQKYSKIMSELNIAAQLVYNTHAKKILLNFTAKKRKSNRIENKKQQQQQQQQQQQPRGRSQTKKFKAKSR